MKPFPFYTVSIAALSVGAFAAAVAAGALAFNDGLALAKVRSELMEKAVLPPCACAPT